MTKNETVKDGPLYSPRDIGHPMYSFGHPLCRFVSAYKLGLMTKFIRGKIIGRPMYRKGPACLVSDQYRTPEKIIG